ncbi:MAG: hypothetical protein C5B46_02365 [Proteobacteria bacterium]|nr:MAG: hypothetical protein C5B46_02365 [Pseudomonadota bacterium]
MKEGPAVVLRSAFGPAEVSVLVAAYDGALAKLQLANRQDPTTLLVAQRIIRLAMDGERDPIRLRDAAIRRLRVRPIRPV